MDRKLKIAVIDKEMNAGRIADCIRKLPAKRRNTVELFYGLSFDADFVFIDFESEICRKSGKSMDYCYANFKDYIKENRLKIFVLFLNRSMEYYEKFEELWMCNDNVVVIRYNKREYFERKIFPFTVTGREEREYITAAAVMMEGKIYLGKRHGDAGMQYMNLAGAKKCNYNKDGFITNTLRFISREEAYMFAKMNGQFKREVLAKKSGCDDTTALEELFSEDLW